LLAEFTPDAEMKNARFFRISTLVSAFSMAITLFQALASSANAAEHFGHAEELTFGRDGSDK
jgi:hypothetical protein